jgi:hypothetical protein
MTPFIFKLTVAIPKLHETIKKEFVFVSRSEAEKFRTQLLPLGAHVTELSGFIPSNCDTALRRVMDELKSKSQDDVANSIA